MQSTLVQTLLCNSSLFKLGSIVKGGQVEPNTMVAIPNVWGVINLDLQGQILKSKFDLSRFDQSKYIIAKDT